MELNRARPTESDRLISNEALRQAYEYTESEPLCFSFNSSCCGRLRQNCGLVDPGYYLNGGPRCQQLRSSCETPSDRDMEAMADGLIPGCIVYAPKTKNQYWPAIVDFCPYECSNFAIFRIGGPLCCTPFAYYLSFIPDWSGHISGGWYTVDCIVPFGTLVNKHVELDVNFNDPHFDSAFERASKYYSVDLTSRLKRFSIVYRAIQTNSRKIRNLKSPGKSISSRVAHQARKFSHEIAKHLRSNYQRVRGGNENMSLSSSAASTSTSSSSVRRPRGLAGTLLRKLSLARPIPVEENPERTCSGQFGRLTLGDLVQEEDHVHHLQDLVPPQQETAEAREGAARKPFYNPTEHLRSALTEPYKRAAVQGLLRSGVQEIRTYKDDETEPDLETSIV